MLKNYAAISPKLVWCGMAWNCFQLLSGSKLIKETLLETAEGIYQDTPKSHRSNRDITIPKEAIEVLKEHKQITGDFKLVFATKSGNYIEPRNFNRAYYSIFKKAGIDKNIRVHDLRHSHGSLLSALGVPLKTIQDRLGHANLQSTNNFSTPIIKLIDKLVINFPKC
jgi:integrase